jgi:hypothetical protein
MLSRLLPRLMITAFDGDLPDRRRRAAPKLQRDQPMAVSSPYYLANAAARRTLVLIVCALISAGSAKHPEWQEPRAKVALFAHDVRE